MCQLGGTQIRRKISADKPIYAFKIFELLDSRASDLRFRPRISPNYVLGGWSRRVRYQSHRRPTTGQRAGFHAVKWPHRSTLAEANYPTRLMIPVKLWGVVIEHKGDRYSQSGYRAQYMEIL